MLTVGLPCVYAHFFFFYFYCRIHWLSHLPLPKWRKRETLLICQKRWKATMNILRLPPPPTFKNRSPNIRHFAKQQFWSLQFPSPSFWKLSLVLSPEDPLGLWALWEHIMKSLTDPLRWKSVVCLTDGSSQLMPGQTGGCKGYFFCTVSPSPTTRWFYQSFLPPRVHLVCYLVVLASMLGSTRTLSHQAQGCVTLW